MYCRHCGKELVTDASFCPFCEEKDTAPKSASPEQTKKPASALVYAIRVIALIVLVWIGAMIYSAYRQNPQFQTAMNRAPDILLAAANNRHSQTVPVLRQAEQVPALHYRWFQLTVDPRYSNARISGSFRAAGGSGNDIEMTVRSEPNGGQVLYASGRVTQSQVDVPLRPGTYYVQFSNAFSVLSSKTVSGDIALTYEY